MSPVLYATDSGHIQLNTVKLFSQKPRSIMDEYDKEETFNVNYEKIINENSLLSITRFLAITLSKNPYLSVGDYMKNMSGGDLKILMNIIDEGEDHPNFSDLMLIAEMLAVGEGLENGTLEIIHHRTNQLLILLSCESLYRKGLIKIHHENMSFGEDMTDAIIAEKL
jgi:hypothetical protein